MKVFNLSTVMERLNGYIWYPNGHRAAMKIGNAYGQSVESVCGVIAALSPGNRWERNIADAEAACKAFAHNNKAPHSLGVYGMKNVAKASAILLGQDPKVTLGGKKVRAFYDNLAFPDTSMEVTIDRHAKRLAYGVANLESEAAVTSKEYDYLAWHYKEIATKIGIMPHELQAVTWLVYKRLNEKHTRGQSDYNVD